MSQNQFGSGLASLPPVTKYILGINILLFIIKQVTKSTVDLDHYLALYYFKSQYFKPYQLITHMFMHGDFPHILFNMFGVYTFGSILERVWGSKRFLNFYMLCGLGAALAQWGSFYYSQVKMDNMADLFTAEDKVTYRYIIDNMSCLGASGALFGLLGAFAFLFPNTQLSIFFFLPMKAKYFVILYGAVELFYGVGSKIGNYPGDNVAHFAHIGGLFVGLIIVYFWRRNSKTFF